MWENFCRIALRSGICRSRSTYISHFYKYFQSCLPKRILLTNSVWECLFLHTRFFFLSLPIGWRNIFLPQIVFLWFLVELSYFVTFGAIYISSRNCILPICCSFFIKDVPRIFRMIIFCLKHVACLFFLSRYFSKWRTHCSHLSSHLCFQLIRNAASITVLCVASHLSPLLFHWLIFCSCTRIKVL